MDWLLSALKAVGETTRLRIVALLGRGELTVSELTQVLDQSQPRVSRHLKLLTEGGLIERYQEGTWVFYRLVDRGEPARLARTLLELMADGAMPGDGAGDLQRLAEVRKVRARAAQRYFRSNAKHWNEIRSLYLPERDVEAHLLGALRGRRVSSLLDIGTGTGRMLQIFADHIERGVGIDASQEMLAIARDMLAREGITNCQARHADMYELPMEADSQDAVIVHQVLHYADDPESALREASRVLRPGGRMLIADFAPHDKEFLREEHAHRRLGFHEHEVEGWGRSAGLHPAAVDHLKGGELTVTVWQLDKQRERKGTA